MQALNDVGVNPLGLELHEIGYGLGHLVSRPLAFVVSGLAHRYPVKEISFRNHKGKMRKGYLEEPMKASARTFPDHKGNQTLQCNVIQVCDSRDYRKTRDLPGDALVLLG